MRALRIGIDARPAAEVPAGRGRYVRELVRHLGELDTPHDFVLYARRPWPEAELHGGFRWRLIGGQSHLWPLIAARRVNRECDVFLSTVSYLMNGVLSIPSLAVVHDLVSFDRSLGAPPGSLLERLTLDLAVRRARALICVSSATRDALVAHRVAARPKSHVVPLAAGSQFESEGADPWPTARRHGIERPFVLATGTLEPRKNLPRLIEAFSDLPAHLRQSHELVLAGPLGWRTADTIAAIERPGAAVRSLGYVPEGDLPDLYRAATVFCYPSLAEGFGLPVLEAMQVGTPVITSRTSSLPEVGGGAARYIDPRDIADLRAALEELLIDSDLRGRMSDQGRRRAAQFSWERTARETLSLIEQAAGHQPNAQPGAAAP